MVERRWASALCKGRAATKVAADTDQRSSAFRFLFLSSYIVTRSADRGDTGDHRQYSLTKIAAESKAFVALFDTRDDDSGADRIARTISYVVIAGLDPAIHADPQHGPPGQARW